MNNSAWETVIQRHLDGLATPDEVADLSRKLEADPKARLLYLQMARVHAHLIEGDLDPVPDPAAQRNPNTANPKPSMTLARWAMAMLAEGDFEARQPFPPSEPNGRPTKPSMSWVRWTSAIAVVLLIVIATGVLLWRPAPAPVIATIARVDGSVQWTGDGGRVSIDLDAGRTLTGGILESLSFDSSVKIQFRDGSTATLSGLSALTISVADDSQKEWYLRYGTLSATIRKQPAGRPLLVHTPAADLEVRGTQFDVIADQSRTNLTVNEGIVRIRKSTDHTFTDVTAAHQATASIASNDLLEAVPIAGQAVHHWKAKLETDVDDGEWISAMVALRREIGRAVDAGEIAESNARRVFAERVVDLREDEGSVHTVPRRLSGDQNVTYLASLSVSRGDAGPVLLAAGNRFRVRGRAYMPAVITIGFSALDRDRSTGGRYSNRRRVEGEFDLELPIEEYRMMNGRGDVASAFGRELVNWFCMTSNREAALEITAVELVGPKK